MNINSLRVQVDSVHKTKESDNPLELLKKVYTTKKVVMVRHQNIMFDKKTFIPIAQQSGWRSKKTQRNYTLGSIWLYLEIQRGNMNNYPLNIKEYDVQEIQECDREDLKAQFLPIKVQIKQQEMLNSTKSSPISKDSQLDQSNKNDQKQSLSNDKLSKTSLEKDASQKQDHSSQKSKNKTKQHTSQQHEQKKPQDLHQIAKQAQKQIDHEHLHQKYIANKLASSKLSTIGQHQSQETKIQSKKQKYQETIYEIVKKPMSELDFYGQFYTDVSFAGKPQKQYHIQTIKFAYSVQKPLTNQRKCLQIPKAHFHQKKINAENSSHQRNRYNTIREKYKNPIIVVPQENMHNGTLYLANFEKFAVHGDYVENVWPPSSSVQRKNQFNYTLKGQRIIFEIMPFKQNLQGSKDPQVLKDQKGVNLFDWSLVAGVVIQGRKQEYEFYNKLKQQNASIEKIKPILINYDKPFEKSIPHDKIKHLSLEKNLRYKDSQVQRQFWKEVQCYLFDN